MPVQEQAADDRGGREHQEPVDEATSADELAHERRSRGADRRRARLDVQHEQEDRAAPRDRRQDVDDPEHDQVRARRQHGGSFPSTRLHILGSALAAAALAAAASARAGSPAQPEPVRLRVAVFNIEYGGTHVSFDKVVSAIERSHADVVGIEEAQTHIHRLAREFGWPYFSTRMQVVSQLPLIDPPGGDGIYLYVELAPGEVVAIENVHLPSNPYGPFRVKQGESRKEVVDLERRVRLPAIRPSLHAEKDLQAEGIPVFLVGDFNSPSWRDWTKEMVGGPDQIRDPGKRPGSPAGERAGV